MVNGNLAYAQNVQSKSNHEGSDELNWCSVLLSEVISRGKRLEATVFDVEGRRAREIIERAKCEKKTITGNDGISEAHTCARFKRNWVEHSAFPIYQPSSILELYPKPDGFIASTTDTNIDALRVHRGQILLTCSGTIGKAIMVTDTLDGKIFSHDLLRITCKDEKDAGFLYAFIKS
ncbi:MAG: hypothetical protein Q4F84_10890, partial [Fibrobacter sp.]|nr:hypothetical protein [Fibrobacter sp.]